MGRASSVGSLPYWDALMLEYETTPNAAATYEDQVIADSPAGYWRLGEASGATATARSGTPNGTYSGSPTLGVSSLVGDTNSGVSFDGTDDLVDCGDVYGFAGTSSFTVELWMNRSNVNLSAYRRVLSKERYVSGTDRGGWSLQLVGSGGTGPDTIRFARYDVSSNWHNLSGTTTTQPGTWYHVVVTYDGATEKLYVNGVLESSASTTLAIASHTRPLRLAVNDTGDNYGGVIDEVAIYTTALSQTRIQAHYNAGRL